MENTSSKHWIGFDLGGTKMMVTLFDDHLTRLNQKKFKTSAAESGQAVIVRITEAITESLKEWNVPLASIAGIGIGVPGAVDMAKGIVLKAPNLMWQDVQLKQILETAFNVPATILNDVDAGTYGEFKLGAAKNGHCVLGVFPGTGIGGACIYQGKILHGASVSAMEIGHIRVVEDGLRCGCGKYGCLETVGSRLAIAGQAAIAAFRGEAPFLYEKVGCDLKKIKSGVLAESVAAGDKAVEEIIRKAAEYLGKAIATAITLIAPDVVVLGGGLVEAMPELYRNHVVESITPALFRVYRDSYRVEIATLGDYAVASGAAAYIKEIV